MVVFGQVVIGPPGSGKSTYCAAMQQKLNSLNRKCIVINLDPQVTLKELPYEPTIDVCNLIDSERVSKAFSLGPNSTLVYCMEYLLENIDWLLEEISKNKDSYLLYDLPGQVELFVHNNATKDIVARLEKANQRLVLINLVDSTLCTDPFKYVAAMLSSLSSQIFIQLPHINVLSKLRLLKRLKNDLAYRLEYYTQAQDLQELLEVLRRGIHIPNSQKFERFTSTLCEIIEDFNLVSFCTADVEDEVSLERLLSSADRAVGYIPFNEGDVYFDLKSKVYNDLAEFDDSSEDSGD
ncbi:uncharacterized protein TOT_010000962 [Theileria orientalis strain Shintoku]|uniref:GPN-loop GTPase 2 n=1 Tax=Theileria orientalis strain Shintoku TaxID=869250 RepID=J4CCJ6_THEOR|nr:uncharacterized protein TOT_010000962 [Theileria orientalis strain Shintoku]BAM39507.1 uncharacterized protein TOT_010000962 [Theileria orientalis strain Shintoku]|eukprot:XP_009689808.1 uncharacterized protein TOT_010000962 [Theileria orientalis strain Shintoku]